MSAPADAAYHEESIATDHNDNTSIATEPPTASHHAAPAMTGSASSHGGHSVATEHVNHGQFPIFAFDLRWALSGALIKHYVPRYEVDVERLGQDLDEGLFEEYGAPRAKTSSEGKWLQMYRLFHGDVELKCGQKLCAIHHGATITVLLQDVHIDEDE